MDDIYDLVININAVPPRTSITVVWNEDLSPFDTKSVHQDERYLVTFTAAHLNESGYGSLTTCHTDTIKKGVEDCPDCVSHRQPMLRFLVIIRD